MPSQPHLLMHTKPIQLCPTICNPMNCSLPGSLVHEIVQARILEWVAMPSSRGSSQPRDWTQVSHIAGRFFTIWATREATLKKSMLQTFGDSVLWIYKEDGACLKGKILPHLTHLYVFILRLMFKASISVLTNCAF